MAARKKAEEWTHQALAKRDTKDDWVTREAKEFADWVKENPWEAADVIGSVLVEPYGMARDAYDVGYGLLSGLWNAATGDTKNRNEDLERAAFGAAAFFIPFVSGVALRGGKKAFRYAKRRGTELKEAAQEQSENLASRSANMYDPPQPLTERKFSDDYPEGSGVADGQPLERDIDGDPRFAGRIAGRSVSGAPDRAMEPLAIREAIEELADLKPGSRREIGDDVGRFKAGDANRGTPHRIRYDATLTPKQLDHVLAHELGHLVYFEGRGDVLKGARREFEGIFHDLNSPSYQAFKPRNRTLPQHVGYEGGAVEMELIAEGFRAYLQNPAYIKAHYPKAAAQLRALVKRSPKVREVLQLNSAAGVVGAGALLLEAGSQNDGASGQNQT